MSLLFLKALNEILDSDDGARYIGEFAIGFNPYVVQPMRDILFDEKIGGSFHFTPGQCYDDASNGNDSQVHWDMVKIQRPDYGGGEIYFDDELIRKDGEFVVSATYLSAHSGGTNVTITNGFNHITSVGARSTNSKLNANTDFF